MKKMKKLQFKKDVVSKLNNDGMRSLRGGQGGMTLDQCTGNCTVGCTYDCTLQCTGGSCACGSDMTCSCQNCSHDCY